MLKKMIEWRRLAAHARCRIKAWKVTEDEAFSLARECQGVFSGRSTFDVVEEMKAGLVRILGAEVIVR